MSEPVKFTAVRYRCPHCSRSGSRRAAITEHIGRCWSNPAAKSCKTCAFYAPYSGPCDETGCNCSSDEECTAGIDLTQFDDADGRRVLPLGCQKWEAIW